MKIFTHKALFSGLSLLLNNDKMTTEKKQNNSKASSSFIALLLFCFFVINSASAQRTLPCNLPERMNSSATFTSMSTASSGGSTLTYLTLGGVLDAADAISADITDYARIGQVLLSLGSKYLTVIDGSGSYPGGTFAGFEISSASLVGLTLLGDITISTYSGTTFRESVSSSSLLASVGLLSSGTRGTVGFVTTMSFDRVRITSSGVSALPSEIRVYNAVFKKFCAGAALPCNTPTVMTSPSYPMSVDAANTKIDGVACVSCSIADADNLIDASTTNYATINLLTSVGTSASVAVVENLTTYTAGTFAGFDIESSSLLTAGVLSNLMISTYNNGIATGDVVSGSSLLSSGSSVLSGSGRMTVGFLATQPFDEVKLTATNLAGLSLGTLRVYGAVFESFCTAALPACNTLTKVTNPTYPVYIDGNNTGIVGVCALCTINNSENVVNSSTTDFATIVLPVGVASSANFAVANAVDAYAANSFAGFDVETNSLLLASVISSATVSLYNNGSLVQTGTGNALIVGASTSLLASTTRQVVGIVANTTYDEVKISFSQLVGADLGTIKIYNAVFQNSCAATILCNNTYYLNATTFPTVINAQRSGVSGVATVDATVTDVWNVVSASTTDYARISNNASVIANGSISVLDPITTYPVGTFAGFVIKTSSAPAVLLDLFGAITIRTYNNGVLQETKSGGTLIDLTVLATLIGTPTGSVYKVGFVTTQAFDEIQISVSSLVGVGLLGGNYVDVYGAFIDTRTSSTIGAVSCMKTSPDINATFVGVAAPGNVTTNDIVPAGTTYGTPTAMPSNPTTTVPTMLSSGAYTFTPTVAGVYEFSVPVCVASSSIPCPTELLTITVLDVTVGSLNPPVVNTDISTTQYNTDVDIAVLLNDAIGTPATHLDTSGMTITDLNGVATGNTARGGTAVVNPTTGVVTYTPATDFIGTDTVEYTVCDDQTTPMCGSAYVIVTVLAPSAANTTAAADDYIQTTQGVATSGNVINNDFDPEGNSVLVVPQTIVVPSQYTFVLSADGTYLFTPDLSYTGPKSFNYQVCDDETPAACASATLYTLVSPMSFPLPVILQKFDVMLNGCAAVLTWKSLSETSLRSYTLQYSANASTWVDVETIVAKGSGSAYQTSHNPAVGKGYYRLKFTNVSGKLNYSKVISIANSCIAIGLKIFPNPASDKVQIVLNDLLEDNSFEIYNSLGKILLKGKLSTVSNNIVDISFLDQGVYLVKVRNGVNLFTQRLSINK